MARIRSPFIGDQALASVSSDIARIFSDPNPAGTATARLRRLQQEELQLKLDAKRGAATRLKGFSGVPTSQQVTGLMGDFIQGDIPVGQAGQAFLVYNANTGQPDPVVARSFVGAGHAIGKDQGFSIPDRELVAGRENAAALTRTATSAGIAAGASRANNADRLAYERQRDEANRFATPQEHEPGKGVYFKPGDPRYAGRTSGDVLVPPRPDSPVGKLFTDRNQYPVGSAEWNQFNDAINKAAQGTQHVVGAGGTLVGADGKPLFTAPPSPRSPTVVAPGSTAIDAEGKTIFTAPDRPEKPETSDQVKARIADKIARGEELTAGEERIARGTIDRPPPADTKVSPDILRGMEWSTLSEVGAIDPDAKQIRPQFQQMYGERLQRAREAMAEVYKTTTDAAKAQAAYRKELGIEVGDQFSEGGWFTKPSITKNPISPTRLEPSTKSGTSSKGGGDTLPPEIAKQLKHGVGTRLSDGSVWTLRDGQPMRVK